MNIKPLVIICCAFLLASCYESGGLSGDSTIDEDGRDIREDRDVNVEGDTVVDVDADTDVRPDYPDVEDGMDCEQQVCIDCECICPDESTHSWEYCQSICFGDPVCPPGCPPDMCPTCTEPPECPEGPPSGPIGAPCTRDYECEGDAGCYPEQVENYDGETYIDWPGGYCSRSGAGSEGCDPMDPGTCPEGATCLYQGEYMGLEWYGCFDACTPADSRGNPYDWACGCREGYQCNSSYGLCLTGCSHDRECCELWDDGNYNGRRDSGEVTFFPECDGYCDNEWDEECRASYSCIYSGSESAIISDPCEHNYQCTPNGSCLSSLLTDPETGDPYYPGGYCTIIDCQLEGRECSEYGGVCANMGGMLSPYYMCVRPCHVGTSPEDEDYKCRTEPEGAEHACMPAWAGAFIEEPPEGEDGYCWVGNFSGGDGAIGEDCSDDDDCASPLGLGFCMDYFGRESFCTVVCSEDLVADHQICGEADGEGVATGLCAWSYCFEGCSDLDSPADENDCSREKMACMPLYVLGSYTYVPEGAERPLGVCMTPCRNDRWCERYFGPSRTCNEETSSCE